MNNIARAEITGVNSNGTYSVRMSGADHDMTNVPCLNFVDLPVGLSVCLDMHDPQAPQIIASANAGVRWAGEQTHTPDGGITTLNGGWRYPFGEWSNGAGYESEVFPDVRHQDWEIPYNTSSALANKTGVQIMRTASWTENDYTRHAVISFAESFQSAFLSDCFVAWDARNIYKLKNPMSTPPHLVVNSTDTIVSVTASSFADKGKVLVVHGTRTVGNSFEHQTENVAIDAFLNGTSSNPFRTITKIEVCNVKAYSGQVLRKPAVLSGDLTVSCGLIYRIVSAGTQVFLASREEIELLPTAGSQDPYEQLSAGDLLLIEDEIVEVQGIVSKTDTPVFGVDTNTTRLVINGRGLYGDASAHAAYSIVRPIFWVAPAKADVVNTLDGPANVIISNGMLIYAGITSAGVSAFARSLRTGELVWSTKTPEYTTGSTPAFIGFVDASATEADPPEELPPVLVVHEVKNDGSASKWFGFNAHDGSAIYNFNGSSYTSNDTVIYCVCNPSSGVVMQHIRTSMTIDGVTTIQRRFKTFDGREGGLLGSNVYEFPEVDVPYEEQTATDPTGAEYRISSTTRAYSHTFVPSPGGDTVDLVFLVHQQTSYDRIGTDTEDPDLKYAYLEFGPVENRALCYRISENASVSLIYNTALSPPTSAGPGPATMNEARVLGVLGYSEESEPHVFAVYGEYSLKEKSVYPTQPLNVGRYLFPIGARIVSFNPSDGSVLGYSPSYIDYPSFEKTNYYTVKNTYITSFYIDEWPDLANYQYYKPRGFFFVNVSMVPGDDLKIRQWNPDATEKSVPGGYPSLDPVYAADTWTADEVGVYVNGHVAFASLLGMSFIGRFKYTSPSINLDEA